MKKAEVGEGDYESCRHPQDGWERTVEMVQ